jgi:hypothetical protein
MEKIILIHKSKNNNWDTIYNIMQNNNMRNLFFENLNHIIVRDF